MLSEVNSSFEAGRLTGQLLVCAALNMRRLVWFSGPS